MDISYVDPQRERFERQYVERSGLESVYEICRIAIPCECGEDECEGYQMLTRDEIVGICLAAREFIKTQTSESLEILKQEVWLTRSLPLSERTK